MVGIFRARASSAAAGSRRRRTWIALLGALAIVVGVGVVHALRADRRPNVVLVLADTLRRDRVGAYGYAAPTTPFLDSVAAAGVVFDNAWSHAPQTLNSTASLLTSRTLPFMQYERRPAEEPGKPPQTVMRGISERWNVTLASAMHDAGYDTFAVFTNPHHHEHSGFQRGFARWTYLEPEEGWAAFAPGNRVNEALRNLLGDRTDAPPFFAYVHYMDAHYPYDAPDEIVRLFATTEGQDMYTNGRPTPERMPTAKDVRFMSERYDAAVRHLDENVRGLFALLGALPSDRPTVVVFTSDHGEEFMEHGGLGHGHSAHPELLRVPLILHGTTIAPGTRVATLARGIDVAPTVLDLAGIAPPERFDGRSLLEPAEAAAAGREKRERAATLESASFAWFGQVRGVTTQWFHLALDHEHEERVVYDLRDDATSKPLGEARIRRRDRHLDRLLREFEKLLYRSLARARRFAVDAVQSPIADERKQQLRALGYVE